MYKAMKIIERYFVQKKNLKFDHSLPNLYKAIAISEDKNEIPEKIKIIWVLLNPKKDRWWVVWSLPPINGDFLL